MRQTNAVAAIVLALTPLLILPHYFFFYDISPKIVVALTGAAIALLLFLREQSLAGFWRLWANPLGRGFCLLLLAQILSLLVSTLFSARAALSWNGGNWRRLGFVSQFAVIVLALMIAAAYSRSRLNIVLRATAATGLAVAFYGILQYFGVDPLLSSNSYHVGEGVTAIVRPPSTLGHADYFAGYLLYVVFWGAALVVTEAQSAWKAIGVAVCVVGSVAIVLSGTRGAMLGLAAGTISLWIWTRPRVTMRRAIFATALGVVCLAFYLSPPGLKLRARSQWALEDLRGGARLWLWRDSLRMASERSLIGFGPETFALEFPRYQSVELSRAYPDFYHESPHNIFLDAFVAQGIPGLAILLGFAAFAFTAARRAAAQRQRAAPFLAAALASGLISGLFVCFTLPGDLYFFATIALLVGSALPDTPPAHTRGSATVPALALSLTAVAIFLYFTIQVTATDIALARAKRDLDAGLIEDAVNAYRLSQRWHPGGSSDDLDFSRALAAASRSVSNPNRVLTASQQAFGAALRATATSEEQQNAWYNLAGFYATRDDFADVETCLRRSVAASPNWFKPHWALAQMLLLSGRREEAVAEAARAGELDGGKDAEIAKFLQSLHDLPASGKAE
jgi:putative inorganic carbon (HCO3(-)) transporter